MLGISKIPKWIIYLCCNWRTGFRPWRAWRISCSLKHTTPCGAKSWKPETACEVPLSSWPGGDGNVGPSLLPYVTASIIGRNYKPLLAKFSFLTRQLLSECTIVFGEYFKMYVTSNKSICIFLNGELTQWTDAKKPCFHTHISSVAFVSFPDNNECDRITEDDRS